MTSSDRKLRADLIRLASTFPARSDERRKILALVNEGDEVGKEIGKPKKPEGDLEGEEKKHFTQQEHSEMQKVEEKDEWGKVKAFLLHTASRHPELRKAALEFIAGCEKLPEGPMRDNCEKKQEEGGQKKKAAGPDKAGRNWRQVGDTWVWQDRDSAFEVFPVPAGPFGTQYKLRMTLPPDLGGGTLLWRGAFATPEKAFKTAQRYWKDFQNPGASLVFENRLWQRVAKVKTDKDCMKKYQNPDGSFKGGKGDAFDNCVKAFSECATGVDDPEAMCAHIGRSTGKIKAAAAKASSKKEAAAAAYNTARALGYSAEAAVIAGRAAAAYHGKNLDW